MNNIISPFLYEPQAVVIDNGAFPVHEYPLSLIAKAPYIVCCDGAANRFITDGGKPDLIVGDGDSLTLQEVHPSIPFLHITEQETNDQTKAILHLASIGKTQIAIVGGTGKREDHTLGNISLLIEYRRKGINVVMATDCGIFIPCYGDHTFVSQKGQQISVFNFGATQFASQGLRYPLPHSLHNWWQGTLNEATGNAFSIQADGDYLLFLNYLP